MNCDAFTTRTSTLTRESLVSAQLTPVGRSEWLPALLPKTNAGQALAPAQRIGRYELVARLGRGGMGEVWRARHRHLASEAAVKVIRPELLAAANPSERRQLLHRFEHEARATARLTSPHTIRLFDFGATPTGMFYYVMELLTGHDLDALVRRSGAVPYSRALYLVSQVCASLAEAHVKGLVHRDVTPSNVYACQMGIEHDFVKVLDFGLVTPIERSMRSGRVWRSPGTTAGTPAFMAPELILNETVSPRSDVYAVGCLMYFLITGEPVFMADSVQALFGCHLWRQPIPPSARVVGIPPELDRFVDSCLNKDPSRRPADGSRLLELLNPLRERWHWSADDATHWWMRRQHGPNATPRARLGLLGSDEDPAGSSSAV